MATIDLLVVGGGGGGGQGRSDGTNGGGGGGAGGYRADTAFVVTPQAYTVTVGTGGASNTAGTDSTFDTITSTGGGKGGYNPDDSVKPANYGGDGGSGGGASYLANLGGSGNTPSTTPSQGNDGGDGVAANGIAAGGGGAGGVGTDGGGSAGTGGAGTSNSISGSSVCYAGGGGGGQAGTATCGGGAGGTPTGGAGNDGTDGLGGGGGGSAGSSSAGGTGGDGVVIIAYATDGSDGVAQTSTGGTITTSGGNTIHTFTSSGTFTMVPYFQPTEDIKNHSTLTTNLVSYWDLEEASGTRYDLHGSNDLTDNSTVQQGTGKSFGNCADFDGSAEYLSHAAITAIDYDGTNNMSLSLWFKAGDVSGVQSLFTNSDTTSGPHLELYLNGTALRASIGNQGVALDSTLTIAADTWYHVVVVLNSSNEYEMYVDGTSKDTGSGATGFNGSAVIRVGAAYTTPSRYFNGLIDEVGVWSKEVSSAEVTDLYNSGDGLPYYVPNDVKNDSTLSTSLVSYWELEADGTDSVVATGNDLTENGSPSYATGILSNGADLNSATPDYFSISNVASLQNASFSFSVWFNCDDFSSSRTLITKPATAPAWTTPYANILIRLNSTTTVDVGLADASTWNSNVFTVPTMSTGVWYHLVVTYDGTVGTLYLNGGGFTNQNNTYSTTVNYNSQHWKFGSDNSGGNGNYDGIIDEIAAWSKELTIGEVRALYGYGTPPNYEDAAPPSGVTAGRLAGNLPLLGAG